MQLVNRGEVWLTDFGMAGKVRPAVVLSVSPTPLDRVLYTVVPHTGTLQGTLYEVSIPTRFLRSGAFNIQGIATFSRAKLLQKLGVLKPAELVLVEDAVCVWLGLVPPNRSAAPSQQTP